MTALCFVFFLCYDVIFFDVLDHVFFGDANFWGSRCWVGSFAGRKSRDISACSLCRGLAIKNNLLLGLRWPLCVTEVSFRRSLGRYGSLFWFRIISLLIWIASSVNRLGWLLNLIMSFGRWQAGKSAAKTFWYTAFNLLLLLLVRRHHLCHVEL